MPRLKATPQQRGQGVRLGTLIRRERRRIVKSQPELAQMAGVGVDWLRKVELGRIAQPSFFAVVSVLKSLRVSVARAMKEIE